MARRGDPEGEHGARVERVDDAVVPEPGGRVVGRALGLVLLTDAPAERLALGILLERPDERQHRRGLLAAHYADPGVRPHPELAGRVRASRHSVVPRAEAAADDDGGLGGGPARDRGDHLRAVLGDTAGLLLLTGHEAPDVLQENE